MVKRLPTMRETWVRALGQEDSLEKEMSTHSSTLAWKIPWTEELGAGYCPGGCKEQGTTERLHFHFLDIECFHHKYLGDMSNTFPISIQMVVYFFLYYTDMVYDINGFSGVEPILDL